MEALNETVKADDTFTPEQREKIEQLRERVLPMLKPEQDDDTFLIKWLIARRFDLDNAEEMLKKHIKFMKLNGLDNLENYEPPEVTNYFYTAMLGYDKEGSIVRLLHIGATDIRGICLSISKIDSLKFATYILQCDSERQKKDRENDVMCDKHVYIFDLQGLTMRAVVQRIVIDRAFTLLKSYEANYPEKLKVAYIINVPSFFSFVYNWVKTVLPESIISKLEVISQDECLSKLSNTIDLSILPAVYGGTRRDSDGDQTCQSLYSKELGTPVPEKLMSTDQLEVLKNDPDAKRITVEYKSLFIVEKLVEEANSILQWDFQTLDYDIRMGLRYKRDENSDSEEIIPPHRVDSHLFPESGNFTCENPGIYELVFDNTYSWMTSKELLVKVNLVPPRRDINYD